MSVCGQLGNIGLSEIYCAAILAIMLFQSVLKGLQPAETSLKYIKPLSDDHLCWSGIF
ncbi:hypothetical protein [Neisseria mucosa]|uniref:hypothetical protein n=1 Tax=Neisseria mucosa TaxID=488 RepID=UPI0001BC4223|nr:hypothetical protein [Neisseria mucosa]